MRLAKNWVPLLTLLPFLAAAPAQAASITGISWTVTGGAAYVGGALGTPATITGGSVVYTPPGTVVTPPNTLVYGGTITVSLKTPGGTLGYVFVGSVTAAIAPTIVFLSSYASDPNAIPEPASLIVWSVLGLTATAGGDDDAWRSPTCPRRRLPWRHR